jgi:hypothetical protein
MLLCDDIAEVATARERGEGEAMAWSRDGGGARKKKRRVVVEEGRGGDSGGAAVGVLQEMGCAVEFGEIRGKFCRRNQIEDKTCEEWRMIPVGVEADGCARNEGEERRIYRRKKRGIAVC